MSRTPPAGITAALRAMAERSDAAPLLPQIDCPTLIVVGEHDAITPVAVSREMHAAIRGSRLEIIAGAGHVPPVEQPEAFSNVLGDFLNGLA
jgi:pimeloyl-ACP methyl ester carboxylesterase